MDTICQSPRAQVAMGTFFMKSPPVRRYQAKFTKTVSEHLKVCHIWRINILKNLCLVICFIHIIQLSLFSNEYLSIAGKKEKMVHVH